mmetsp:Transcript_39675/g.132269  ORF Transcript_39675/g.132269 Transcript_39675/m.132269 type:complete len:271 (-) Transcript_39675:815-1627(-)
MQREGHAAPIGRDGHRGVDWRVDEGGSGVADVLVYVGEPHHQRRREANEAGTREHTAIGPLRGDLDSACEARQLGDHLSVPSLEGGVGTKGVVVRIVLVEPTLNELGIEALDRQRAVVPPPRPLLGGVTCCLGGHPRRHGTRRGVALHVQVREIEWVVGDRVVHQLKLCAGMEGRETELSRVVIKKQPKIVVGRLHGAMYIRVEQPPDCVHRLGGEAVDGDSLKGGCELEVEVLDMSHEVGHREEGGDQSLLSKPPAGQHGGGECNVDRV